VLQHNAALDKGFLNASRRSEMEFALMWCNEESGEPDYTEAQLLLLARTLGERYLSQANYLRAPDGRKVLVISRPDRLITRFGVEGTGAVLKAMQAATQEWGGLFLVGIQHPAPKNLVRLRQAGFDACTLYCYSSHGMAAGASAGSYDTILPAMEPLWQRAASGGELPIIPCVSPGWDSRPWYGDRGLVRTECSPRKFGRLCRTLAQYADPALGLVLVGTWNEFGEGTYVEPTEERGCSFLDAMQRAFSPQAEPHGLLRPTAEERTQLVYGDVPAHLEAQLARQDGNLVINPGFEREWGWACFDESPVTFTTETVHSGRRAVLLTQAQGGVKSARLAPGVPWPGRFDNRIRLGPGQSYRIAAWVSGRARLTAALFGQDGAWLNRYQQVAEGGQPGEWRKLEAVVTVNDPEAASIDVEVVPLDESIVVDDVGVWRLPPDKPH
jgi:hypothetical protein